MVGESWQRAKTLIDDARHIVVLQAENPDADSLGSAVALEEILGEMGKQVTLFCAIDLPHYLHYIHGWDRVENELPRSFDLAIVVDASVQSLFERALTPENTAALSRVPSIIFDHHANFNGENHLDKYLGQVLTINEPAHVATGELLYAWAKAVDAPVTMQAAENMLIAILGDSLGLTTEAVTAQTLHTAGELIEHGAKISDIETRRREFMKKSPEILHYKGELLQRVTYHAEGQLALVHIPWEEIEKYSEQFNPSALVIDEMRLVEGVKVAIALKTYPDGKITAKIRANPSAPIADKIGEHFDAGGHQFAAGFKVYRDDFIALKNELISVVNQLLHDAATRTENC